MRSASTRQSALRAKPGLCPVAEQAGIGQVGHPGLAFGGAAGRPGREASFAHRLGHLAHLFAAAAAVFDDTLEEVGGLLLPVDAGEGLVQRGDQRVFHAVVAGRGEALDDHRLQALDHHAAAHLGGAGHAQPLVGQAGRKAQALQQRQKRSRVGPAQQQRHPDAVGRHAGHHRAFDIAAARRR
jgi:hypothetical protein